MSNKTNISLGKEIKEGYKTYNVMSYLQIPISLDVPALSEEEAHELIQSAFSECIRSIDLEIVLQDGEVIRPNILDSSLEVSDEYDAQIR
ncbi:hypothetical protein [Terribacillus sp. 7520-G]|uniref:hypothetical protein n=1 Tax=Terribacillus sp. 7520-G TaxID=2025389 RepID=UPI000BA5063D|nr:hypothetical protein [Terribacillus sp. 7520-G]PAD39841.1 hypothetical protein CHH53_03925 [Terribacillus sp. 7520-G]